MMQLTRSTSSSINGHHYRGITVPNLVLGAVSLPLFGFVFCIVLSYIKNFENSTRTHCDVFNLAPSISAAIGSFIPQKYVWQACIALHSAPRYLFAYLYVQHHYERLTMTWRNRWLVKINCGFNVVENVALLGLSLISSQERFEIHKFCFSAFLFCSFCYMCLTYFLFKRCGYLPQNQDEFRSLRYKNTILKIYLACIPLMLIFYFRHNAYCEPYVYTFFCFFEYVLVISNMCYHMTAVYDLKNALLVVPRREPTYDLIKDLSIA